MLTLDKKQALKLRDKLLHISVVKIPTGGFGFEVLSDTGQVYALRRMESPLRLSFATVDGAMGTIRHLNFEKFTVRL